MPPGGFFDDDDDEVLQSPVRRPRESSTLANQTTDSFLSELDPASPRARHPPRGSQAPLWAGERTTSSIRASSVATDDPRAASPSLEDILGQKAVGTGERNIERLIRAWNNEMGAPELLVFPRELVEQVVKDLAKRRELVREANRPQQRRQNEAFYIQASIAATENMRASHVLKSFTRERIAKIEKFAQYYLHELALVHGKPDDERTGEDQDMLIRMYHNELAHAQGYAQLVDTYYRASAIDSMPDKIAARLNEVTIYPSPDLTQAVFVRARRECGPIVLPNGELLLLEKDSQHMLRYSSVRALLRQGVVELL